jgi:DNA-binding transcriptional regulator of glucitol operon
MPKAKTTKKKTTTKTKPKKVEEVVEVLKVPKSEPDPSLWRENGFASERAYRKFLQPNS